MAPGPRTKTVPRSRAATYAREAREVLNGAQAAHASGHDRLAALGAVNACVRAADALCVIDLGRHASGDDHDQAIALLRETKHGRELASKFLRVLQRKTAWSYGVEAISRSELTRVFRLAESLVSAAERPR